MAIQQTVTEVNDQLLRSLEKADAHIEVWGGLDPKL